MFDGGMQIRNSAKDKGNKTCADFIESGWLLGMWNNARHAVSAIPT